MNNLKANRTQRDMAQIDVALAVGSSLRAYTLWETGKHPPSQAYRQKLCKLFGKSCEELGLDKNVNWGGYRPKVVK